jgi:hypothetical protein
VKHELQHQHQLDRQIRVASLTSGVVRRGACHPAIAASSIHRVSSSLEAGFVLRPILDPVASQRNAVKASGVRLGFVHYRGLVCLDVEPHSFKARIARLSRSWSISAETTIPPRYTALIGMAFLLS